MAYITTEEVRMRENYIINIYTFLTLYFFYFAMKYLLFVPFADMPKWTLFCIIIALTLQMVCQNMFFVKNKDIWSWWVLPSTIVLVDFSDEFWFVSNKPVMHRQHRRHNTITNDYWITQCMILHVLIGQASWWDLSGSGHTQSQLEIPRGSAVLRV